MACIQSISSACNYCIQAKMGAGIYAARLVASIRCRDTVSRYWMQHHCLYLIAFQWLLLSYLSNKKYRGIGNQSECKYWRETNCCKCWMQHNSLHRKHFHFLLLLYQSKNERRHIYSQIECKYCMNCIQICFTIWGLHLKIIFCYPVLKWTIFPSAFSKQHW